MTLEQVPLHYEQNKHFYLLNWLQVVIRTREPNLDFNSRPEIELPDFKYLKSIPTLNKEEWVEKQMGDQYIFDTIIEKAESPYRWGHEKYEWGDVRDTSHKKVQENKRKYCKIVLKLQWDRLFSEMHDQEKILERKNRKFYIKMRHKYPSLEHYTHVNEFNLIYIKADLRDVIKFCGIVDKRKMDFWGRTWGYDSRGRKIGISRGGGDTYIIELPL